ncbi:MAG: hydroxyacid dehydrogenase [Pseudorhodoplanes sp.]|nr:hydroxyacid dehydrogenase [Pseudorhodoplanes sp.]
MASGRFSVVYLGAPEGAEAARGVLADGFEVRHPEHTPGAVADALRGADALLDASMKVPIDDRMISESPKLRIISCATTGSDHIARDVLSGRGIPVRTLREDGELLRNITPAAELTFALLLACARRLPAALNAVKRGEWVREDFPGLMLNGRRLGVIGCGRIGGWMARYARAFGMDVVGYDPFLTAFPPDIAPVELEELVETSDAVTVHVHLSDKTRGLVSADLFKRIKPGAIFLNTSRGAVADEAALLAALESGRVSAAGLDVLEGEPDVARHPLRLYAERHDNLLITPHCGGFSPDAVRVVCRRAAEKIRDHLQGAAS